MIMLISSIDQCKVHHQDGRQAQLEARGFWRVCALPRVAEQGYRSTRCAIHLVPIPLVHSTPVFFLAYCRATNQQQEDAASAAKREEEKERLMQDMLAVFDQYKDREREVDPCFVIYWCVHFLLIGCRM
jgi:hypothetical protein